MQQSRSSYMTLCKESFGFFDFSYQQLWLCSYRVSKHLNAYGSLHLAIVAHRLGFSSKKIEQELNKDPAHGVIEEAILESLKVLRPNEAFAFDTNQARPLITSLKDYLDKILGAPVNTALQFLTVAGSGVPLAVDVDIGPRISRISIISFSTRYMLPFKHIERGDEISSIYVKRSRHIAFFGPLNLTEDQAVRTSNVTTTTQMLLATGEPTFPASVSEEQDINHGKNTPSANMNQITPSHKGGWSRSGWSRGGWCRSSWNRSCSAISIRSSLVKSR